MPRKKAPFKQSETNVGLCGHVDHGKTTLVKAMSGIWTQRYSSENERGITIKLGYAASSIYQCPECGKHWTEFLAEQGRKEKIEKGEWSKNTPKMVCPNCKKKLEFKRRISFVDAPGHEILMATMLSGASLMDGALVLVAANEPVGMPQTKEHLAALDIANVENVIIVQNKIDAVTKEQAIKHYEELKEFLKQYKCARNAPIIPVSAVFGANIDLVVEAIEELIPTPELEEDAEFTFNVARSFDVNKPGTPINKLIGGVIGGSVVSGMVKVGDQIEIRPGIKDPDGKWRSVITEVVSIYEGNHALKEAHPGGLIALGTKLDPAVTRTDQMIGNLVGEPGKLPDVKWKVKIEVHLLEKVLGAEEEIKVDPIKPKEPLMIVVATSLSAGIVTKILKNNIIELDLKRPICAFEGAIVALSRRINNRWRLIGHGYLAE